MNPDGLRTVVVTHGNLMALMLKTFDDRIGFELWERLTYPDVYSVTVSEMHSAVQWIIASSTALAEQLSITFKPTR